MFSKLTLSAVLASAIALAPVATPQAQARDAGDVIAGIALLGLLGGTALHIHNRQHGYTPRHNPVPRQVHQNPGHHVNPVPSRGYHRNVGHVHQPRQHHTPRYHQPAKPSECLRQRWTNHGWKTYYSQRCLTRYGY